MTATLDLLPLDALEEGWDPGGAYFGGLPSELPDLGKRPVAVDTETNGLWVDLGARVCVVSLSWVTDDYEIESRAFPFFQDMDRHPERNLPRREWDALREWLDGHPYQVYHNSIFDLPMMAAGTPHGWPGIDLTEQFKWDTLISARGLDPRHEAGLKETGSRLWGPEVAEEAAEVKEGLKYFAKLLGKGNTKRFDMLDWNILGPYAAQDTDLTIALFHTHWQRLLRGEFYTGTLRREMRVARTLARMEMRGVPYDVDRSRQIARDLAVRVHTLNQKLPFEPSGVKDKKIYFFGEKGERTSRGVKSLARKPTMTTATGHPKLDQEVVSELANNNVTGARDYEVWKLATDSRTKYYDGWADKTGDDGRLRTRYKQTKVRSGRLSSTHVNLQAMPADFRMRKILVDGMETPRQLIRPPRGYEMWEMDLAQAELRVAAMYANCAKMLEIIHEGRDPHGETATGLFGVEPGTDEFKQMRQVGKRGNFSLIFGVGAKKFKDDVRQQTGLDFSLSRMEKIVKDWNGLYPEFKRAIYRHMNMAERDLFTRVRGPVMRWYEENEQKHKAFNQRVQGNLGEFGKRWMVAAEDMLHDMDLGPHPGAGLLLQIHDSLVLQLPEGSEALAQQVADIAKFDLWPVWFPDVPGDVDLKPWGKG